MYDDVIYKGRFIWNRLKAEINRREHGITFEKATEAFDNPFFVVGERQNSNEIRPCFPSGK